MVELRVWFVCMNSGISFLGAPNDLITYNVPIYYWVRKNFQPPNSAGPFLCLPASCLVVAGHVEVFYPATCRKAWKELLAIWQGFHFSHSSLDGNGPEAEQQAAESCNRIPALSTKLLSASNYQVSLRLLTFSTSLYINPTKCDWTQNATYIHLQLIVLFGPEKHMYPWDSDGMAG